MIFNTLEELVRETLECSREGKIIWTNGCFDLFHIGHLKSLEAASIVDGIVNDFLFVGVNSDRSIRTIKSDFRPIIPQDQRAAIVDALNCVQGTIIFDDPTPCAIIAELKPDIFVKGLDWKDKDFPERAIVESYGGRVEFVDSGSDVTTTGIIERIVELHRDDLPTTGEEDGIWTKKLEDEFDSLAAKEALSRINQGERKRLEFLSEWRNRAL